MSAMQSSLWSYISFCESSFRADGPSMKFSQLNKNQQRLSATGPLTVVVDGL